MAASLNLHLLHQALQTFDRLITWSIKMAASSNLHQTLQVPGWLTPGQRICLAHYLPLASHPYLVNWLLTEENDWLISSILGFTPIRPINNWSKKMLHPRASVLDLTPISFKFNSYLIQVQLPSHSSSTLTLFGFNSHIFWIQLPSSLGSTPIHLINNQSKKIATPSYLHLGSYCYLIRVQLSSYLG